MDDARYPPNPAARFLSPTIASYGAGDVDDDVSTSFADSDDVGGSRAYSSSSSQSRGKRRRLDKFAVGFEFAPRVAPKPPPPTARSPADWSEGSTFALLDTWGGPFVQNDRKSLRSDEWSEVARHVSRASKIPRSDAQCRVDTLKKKYKKEKARMATSVNSTTNWVYFDRTDALTSSPAPRLEKSRAFLNGQNEVRDSSEDTGAEDGDEEEEDDDSDGLPPIKERPFSSFTMLADSIRRFRDREQQAAELERMRKEFQKDLELQKKQILERAQQEIGRIKRADEEDDDEEEDGEVSASFSPH